MVDHAATVRVAGFDSRMVTEDSAMQCKTCNNIRSLGHTYCFACAVKRIAERSYLRYAPTRGRRLKRTNGGAVLPTERKAQ
jgi:hypothetical protein